MADDYTSPGSGALLGATGGDDHRLEVALDWLAYRVPTIGRFLHPEMAPLVQNGRLMRSALRREMTTEEELMSEIRLQGIDRLEDVRAVYLEGNGEISVIAAAR